MSISDKIGRFVLRRRLSHQKRVREICNLDLAQSVGIIFSASDQQSYDRASKFVNFLITSKEIQVSALGYVDNKQMLHFFSDKRNFKFFSRKNCNWYGKPKNPSVDTFIDNEYDILIDLSLDSSFPIEYIVSLSKAKLKVGRFVEGSEHIYDFMLDVSKDNTLDNLINQIELYLSIVNVNIYNKYE